MKIHLSLLLVGFVSILFETQNSVGQENWPQFRGPGSRGVGLSEDLPDTWSATENVEWKSEIAGRGWGSPVVWGDFAFVSTCVNLGETEPIKKGLYFGGDRPEPPKSEHEWKVLALKLSTGDVVWEKTLYKGVPTTPIHLKNSYASETPFTDGKHLFVCFGNVAIFCLDFEGNLKWEHKLEPQPMRLGWGTASSLAAHENLLFYQADNETESYLLALRKSDGTIAWRTTREEKSNWSTPYVWANSQRTEVVTVGTKAIRSYDLDGNLLWSLSGMSSITIATPYEADGLLYVSSGYVLDKTKSVYAFKPGANGDITLPEGESTSPFVAWSNQTIAPYNPSTLVYDGRLYVLYDRGTLSCFSAADGTPIYERQRLERSAAITVSPWAYGGKLFTLDEDGVCNVIRAGEKFETIRVNELSADDLCMATPAIAGDRLLIRTDKRIYCIRQKK